MAFQSACGRGSTAFARTGWVAKQLGFQFLLADALGQRPTYSCRRRSFELLVDCAKPHPTTTCDLALPEP